MQLAWCCGSSTSTCAVECRSARPDRHELCGRLLRCHSNKSQCSAEHTCRAWQDERPWRCCKSAAARRVLCGAGPVAPDMSRCSTSSYSALPVTVGPAGEVEHGRAWCQSGNVGGLKRASDKAHLDIDLEQQQQRWPPPVDLPVEREARSIADTAYSSERPVSGANRTELRSACKVRLASRVQAAIGQCSLPSYRAASRCRLLATDRCGSISTSEMRRARLYGGCVALRRPGSGSAPVGGTRSANGASVSQIEREEAIVCTDVHHKSTLLTGKPAQRTELIAQRDVHAWLRAVVRPTGLFLSYLISN